MRYYPCLYILFFLLPSPELFARDKGLTSDSRLFHIERSKNRNLVCYDVNLSGDTWDAKQPLDVYWVNREERPGEVKGLSGVEKRFAYGYKVIAREEDSCRITLSAYPGRELTLRQQDGTYICVIMIAGQPAILQKLYVQAKPTNSLSVEYVELTGISVATGEILIEKVIP